MKKFVSLIFIPFFFISCSRKLIKTSSEYQDKYINADKLYVQFVPEKPIIKIHDKLISSLGTGSKEDNYLTYFKKNFQTFVNQYSTFKPVHFSSEIQQFDEIELPINQNIKLLFKIPCHPTNETTKDNELGITLLLEYIQIHHKKGDRNILIPADAGILFIGGDNPKIIHVGRFLLWDNNLNKVVSYGQIDIRTRVKRKKVEETWNNAFDALAKQIFSDSPFQKYKS